MIAVPDLVRDGSLAVVASVSGGKDSTALILALREAEVASRYVFADTGWEAPETYAYLDTLRETLGITIDVVRADGTMVDRIRKRHGFPGRMQRWCTRELKLEPLRKYHDALGVETASAMGVRGEESEKRARMAEWEDSDEWSGWTWRPLIRWSVQEVLAIHHRHGVPVNPLYRRGHDRVGCFPCIYSRKDEIRLIAAWRSDDRAARDVPRVRQETQARLVHSRDAAADLRIVPRRTTSSRRASWARGRVTKVGERGFSVARAEPGVAFSDFPRAHD